MRGDTQEAELALRDEHIKALQAEIDRWIELCKVHDEIGNTLLADVVSLQDEIDKLKADNEFMSAIIERETNTFAKQQAEIDALKKEIEGIYEDMAGEDI